MPRLEPVRAIALPRRFALAALWSVLRPSNRAHRSILISTFSMELTNRGAGPLHRTDEGPMSAGELINWYLHNGYTIPQIRAMFPGLFADTPTFESKAHSDDWHVEGHWQDGGEPATDDAAYGLAPEFS